ncbi:MAG: tetratricopeptide repeat protein [Deltaproteobacteria bacterium]|nr:tetratricopeptide repeat protein [Deltaproteobacteria bacterium]
MDVLTYMIEHREGFVSHDELLDALWPDVSVTPAALSQSVYKVRIAVGDDGDHQTVLRTRHGQGFQFVAEVSVVRTPVATSLPPPNPDPPSIAVLPFVNMSGDPEQEYFSDGITEELIHTLTAIDNLRVVGRSSSFFFKGQDIDSREIGEKLGISHVLEGSVRRSGARLRITAQLIGTNDGFHLWSSSYDRELADIFEIQEEVAAAIARALRMELGVEVAKSVAGRTTDNLEAYTWHLRGMDLFARADATTLPAAREAFERVIELDPEYLPAYLGSAHTSRWMLAFGIRSGDDALVHAERRLRQALALDSEYGAAHALLGAVLAHQGDWPGAEEAFKRGIELDPSGSAPFTYGEVLAIMRSRPQEAIVWMERSRIDPFDLNGLASYADALGRAGRTDEAEGELRRILVLDPTYSYTHHVLGEVNLMRNRYVSAVRWWVEAFEHDPKSVALPFDMVLALLDLADAESAACWVELTERNDDYGYFAGQARFAHALYRGDQILSESISRQLAENVQQIEEFQYMHLLAWLRVLQRADPARAMQVYQRHYPQLHEEKPQVDAWNHAGAISLADWMRRSGDDKRADLLLEQSLSVLRETTDPWHGPAATAAQLLLGELDLALAALRKAIDSSWRDTWWLLEREPIYAPLWDHPEFQTLMAELRADMARQLVELRELERREEFVVIPRN